MAKRVWYLKPGAAFKRFWADLNFVERRQYKAQRTVPARWHFKALNNELEKLYSRTTISSLVYANNPWGVLAARESFKPSKTTAKAVADHVATAKGRGLVLMFLTGKEELWAK